MGLSTPARHPQPQRRTLQYSFPCAPGFSSRFGGGGWAGPSAGRFLDCLAAASDGRALFESILGLMVRSLIHATEAGIRAKFRAARAGTRMHPGFGKRRTEWGRHALSALTWCRTDKGAHNDHGYTTYTRQTARRVPSATTPSKGGKHIVFECPAYRPARSHLGEVSSWEQLDNQIWITEDGDSGGVFLFHIQRATGAVGGIAVATGVGFGGSWIPISFRFVCP